MYSIRGCARVRGRETGAFLWTRMSTIDAIVLYFQSTRIFPSWTSPVRPRSPALKINNLQPSVFAQDSVYSIKRRSDRSPRRNSSDETRFENASHGQECTATARGGQGAPMPADGACHHGASRAWRVSARPRRPDPEPSPPPEPATAGTPLCKFSIPSC